VHKPTGRASPQVCRLAWPPYVPVHALFQEEDGSQWQQDKVGAMQAPMMAQRRKEVPECGRERACTSS